MVFGFGKKRTTESSVESIPHRKEVSLNDLASFLKEIESPRVLKIVNEAKKIKEGIETNRKSINSIILQLEADDLKLDNVDKNLQIVGKRGKEAVVSTIKKETTAKLSNIEKYEDVITFTAEVNQILKKIGDILGLNTRVMHVFARKYADKLKEEITKLAQNRNLLQKFVTEQESFMRNIENIFLLEKEINNLKNESLQKKHRLSETTNEIQRSKLVLENLKGEIHLFKSKNEYQEFLEIKKKMESLSGERDQIKGKMDAQFSKISRPVSKYSYISSFEKPMKKLMEELLSEPHNVISTQNKSAIIEILEAVSKSALAGNISVKDSQKTIEQIRETINRLDEFLTLKDRYASKVLELERRLGVFDIKALETKERELEKTKVNISDLESSCKRLEKELSENESSIDKTKTELETALTNLHNTKVIVKI